MIITDIFIRRPVLSLVLSLLILIAGLQAVRSVNVRQFPRTQNASVTVMTVYVGANAELVRGFITTPLERAIASADGIEYMKSQSKQGMSTITVRLKLNYDPLKALAEISTKVDQVRQDLPPESEVPVINVVSADSQFAAAYLSFQSDILDQNQITDYLIRIVQPRLSAIEGMQLAEILGDRTFAMRIWLQPDRMAAFNISPVQVRQVLAANNYLAAVGQTKGSLIQVNLTANTDLHTAEEFKKLVILQQDGSIVRLEDIAQVALGAQDYESSVRLSGQTAVFMAMYPLPNANTLDVIALVRDEMEEIQKNLPSGLTARIAYDATEYIENAISEVLITLTETLIIVIIVIFLFLGSLRSILIPVVAIPLSLIGAVFMMQVFGFTINLLTLLAIVLSVGMVVDDAIVIVENVERHLSQGKSPLDAAMLGARELVGPVIAMTVTLAAVYAPIGLQGGLTGSLFREFVFTLSGSVLISGIVALTLSPMMASKMLKPQTEAGGFSKKIAANFIWVKATYGRMLDVTLRCRPAVYIIWIGLTLATIPMFTMSPAELAPIEDEGAIFTIIDAPASSALELTSHYMAAANDILQKIPETDFTFEVIFPTNGFGGLITKPWGERERTTSQILAEIQQKLSAIPGIRVMPVTPPPLPGGGDFPVEIVITSTAEPEDLLVFAQQLKLKAIESHMFAFPPLIDVKMDQPQAELIIDRDKVADLGLNLQQVGYDVSSMLGGNYVNRF
ncbi:MAG: MMPL family transporter, partial [Deltaproteobacteria bacterium]|nr:MMPL family transporter [Deltaproteobacteria bacterium]